MAKDSSPKCPKCGGTDVELISRKDGYLNNPPEDGERPITTAAVYVCPCGETFTVVVKIRQKK